ncbi:hypothetical protein HGB13_00590 [bacterium]|nr:hypothetical protein [bacterium]
MVITLPNGQIISESDPNYATYAAQQGGSTSSAPTTTSTVTPALSLADAQTQASSALSSGLVSPMSLSDIRAREAEQKASSAKSVNAQYAPQILNEQASGRRAVSAAEGSLAGVNAGAGMGVGSAQVAFLAATQNDVNTRVKMVEDQKAAALQAGDLAAVTRADEAINKLNEYNNNLTIAKANYALQLMGQNLQERQFSLQESAQEFDQDMAQKNLSVSLAQLTGEYEGSPTMAATQNKIQNALAEANITGFYEGKKTLDALTTEAQLKLQQQGIDIQKDQLAETIRSNRAQEGLSAARLKADGTKDATKTASDVVKSTVDRLVSLKNAGQLNDLNYAAETKILADTLGYDETSIGQLQSMVNQAMSGDQSARNYLNNQANQAVGSDFILSSPQSNSKISAIKDALSKAKNMQYIPGAGYEANKSKADKVINDLTLGMSAEQKALTIAQASKLVN